MRSRPSALLATVAALAFATGVFALPKQFVKPTTWASYLVTNDGTGIKDADFATLVKNTRNGLMGNRKFSFIASFTQCFGGGFTDELSRPALGLNLYGANSASAYFEPSSYDPAAVGNVGSFYSFAWKSSADVAAKPNDEIITGNASDAIDMAKPVVAGIPKNPRSAVERPQYRTDRAAGGPPQSLGSAQHNYAILFVGQPEATGQDYKDLNDLFTVLTSPRYGFAVGDIYILWADGVDPNGADAWVPDRPSNNADLQWAFNSIKNRINNQPAADTYQIFFWAGDHGNADAPLTMVVDDASQGLPGTGVAQQKGFGLAGDTIYLAGNGTNSALLVEATAGGDLKALSFGDDFQNPATFFRSYDASSTAILYFSVDNLSDGLAGSEVAAENARLPARRAGADVYVWTQTSNRQMFNGTRLGLLKGKPNDELNDFVLRDITRMLNPQTRLPTRPVFFTTGADSRIWVFDPNFANSYVYYDWNLQFPNMPPRLVDALAMVVDLTRRNPAGRLYFDWTKDYMLFSVGRTEVAMPWAGFRPCDVLRFGMGRMPDVFASCAQLGLKLTDNVDGLDVGAGADGDPISFDQEKPWPSPYPNSPMTPPPPIMTANPGR
ncbi:MAG TPA: hypothetical protein VMM92_02130 [Thermoanaerobaculia bacterium]|nr:hypothetical protein [Thermoanaerobaculia bacterium]